MFTLTLTLFFFIGIRGVMQPASRVDRGNEWLSEEEARGEGKAPGRCLWGWGERGVFFFRGQNSHQVWVIVCPVCSRQIHNRRKPKGDGGKGTAKKKRHDNLRHFAGSSRVGSSLRVGVGAPPCLELWRGHCAEVCPSPRGECELTISEESFQVTPLSER